MTVTDNSAANSLRALLYTIGFAVLWFGLAAIKPTTTYHLAPIIMPLVPAGVLLSSPISRRSATALPLVAGGLSLATTALMSSFGYLAGPSLLPSGGAALESVVFTVVASALGLGLGWRTTRELVSS
jgi:hypothetical protein